MTDTNQEDIFASNDGEPTPQEPKTQEQNTPATPEPRQDVFADKLKEILNENGEPKYKDIATALDALKASQQHIRSIEQENKTYQEKLEEASAELERRKSVEEFADLLTKNTDPQPTSETPAQPEGLSADQIQQIIEGKLQEKEAAAQAAKNLSMVQEAVKQAHGEKAAEFLKNRAVELGMTVDELKDQSARNPRVALTLLDVKAVSSSPSSSTTTVPRNQQPENERPVWERGAARGGLTNSELVERFRESSKFTHKRLGIE